MVFLPNCYKKCDWRYHKYSITEHYLCVLYCEVSTLFTSIQPHWSKQSTTLYGTKKFQKMKTTIFDRFTRDSTVPPDVNIINTYDVGAQQWVRERETCTNDCGSLLTVSIVATASAEGAAGRRAGHVPLTFNCNVTRRAARRVTPRLVHTARVHR